MHKVPRNFADLHVHTNCSDGIYPPTLAVEKAQDIGLRAIAITDHDCTEGLDEALLAGESRDVEVIPGVEISACCGNVDIHLLGYFIDHKRKEFASFLDRLTRSRVQRILEMIRLLKKKGIDIEFEEVTKIAKRGSFGRMQLARAMVTKGIVSNVQSVFNKYIRDGGPCFVSHKKVEYTEAISEIISSGGIAVLAHPGMMGRDEDIDRYIEAGLKGIEVYHYKHSRSAVKKYLEIARDKDLLITGGSDCHGAAPKKIPEMGQGGVEYKYVEAMRREFFASRYEQ